MGCPNDNPWWRHQMETFSALLALCAGKSPLTGEFPAQRPVSRCFDVFFDLRLNKPLSKHSWGWWFETSSRSFWRHCNTVVPPVASRLIAWQLSVFNVYRDMVHHCLLVSFSWSRAIPGLGRNCPGMRCSDHWAGNGWPRQDLGKCKISWYRAHKMIMCSHAEIMCSDNSKFLRWKLGVVGERLL